MDSLLKATRVAMVFAVLAATAEAGPGSYVPAIATADFLMSPVFLWVAANAIIVAIWLLSSSHGGSTNDATSSPPGDDGEAVHDAADSLYTSSSEYEYFSDAGSARRAADAPPVSRRLAREARRADRPRVRKKPAVQDDAPGPRRAVAAAAAREPDDERRGAETPVAFAAAAADGVDGEGEDEDVSMDSLWQSIVQRRAARPVVVQKSESWGNDELPRLQRVAKTAAETRREMRKSVSAVSNTAAAAPQPPSALRQLGWRTRDVLEAIAPDELLRRAESFIRRQHEHLRLQRQESEQRQLQLQRRLQQVPALIRV
ncbi:hypothetical protein PAHAL_9G212300 [Panicum hallii]|jgi:hypothetical protein|uniref:DUF4408 domain-containing protein n=1 Tax=Panicum hallii TaxID=206008 RepID=A0A2S3ILA8_9POAL|nr:uncharacterized protein LOC112876415 [Panicum hallii]PAN46759.1 hypothetical protein PAHAL_9G212300 [Panicum hallii]